MQLIFKNKSYFLGHFSLRWQAYEQYDSDKGP
jgi:hypothetical protein